MKQTKILWSCLFCLVALVIGLTCLSSCGFKSLFSKNEPDTETESATGDDSCNHAWSPWAVVTPATCTEGGVRERICSKCQKLEPGNIAPLGHDWGEWEETVAPSCQAHGVLTRVCKNNDAHVESKQTEERQHVFDREVVDAKYLKSEATCTARAVYYKSCVCGLHETGDYAAVFTFGAPPAHSVSNWVSIGSAGHRGSCECGRTETLPHVWNDGVTISEPTHTQDGQMLYTCVDCGATKTAKLAATKDHEFPNEWTMDGDLHYRECSCGKIEMYPHEWGDGVISVAPDCSKEGVKTYICGSGCGATKVVSIPKTTDHKYTVCEYMDEALHTLTCDCCGKVLYQDHDWQRNEKKDVAPTHVAVGVEAYLCVGCGAEKTKTVAPSEELANAHTFKNSWLPFDSTHHRLICDCGEVELAVHEWDVEVTKEATHTEEGERRYTCKCGETKTEVVEKLEGHTFGEWTEAESGHKRVCACGAYEEAEHAWDAKGEITLQPTHLLEGEIVFTCTDCGATAAKVLEKTKEHTFGEWYHDEDPDVHVRKCACGETEREAHAWDSGRVTLAPTCSKEGERTKICTVCGAKKIESVEKTEHANLVYISKSALIHEVKCMDCETSVEEKHVWDNGRETNPATCQKGAVWVYTCKLCSHEVTEEKTELADHTYGDWEIAENGGSVRYCTVCNDKDTSEHHWDQGTVTNPATHTGEGTKLYTCTDEGCDATFEASIPKTPEHTYNVKDPTNEDALKSKATCQAYALYYYVCACGHVPTDGDATTFPYEEGSLAEHVFQREDFDPKYIRNEASCGVDATYYKSCLYCEAHGTEEYFTEEGSALEHNYTESLIPARCGQSGLRTYTCGNCGDIQTEEIPALEHVWVEEKKAASCLNGGTSGYIKTYCKNDGCTAGEYTEILPEHSYLVEITAATCTKDGEERRVCTVCGHEPEPIKLEATGEHDYSRKIVESVQTCTTPGITKYMCKGCGEFKRNEEGTEIYVDYEPALEHEHFAYDYVEATCLTPKYKRSVCKCGYVLQSVAQGQANGHSWTDGKKIDPTCTAEGSLEQHCSVKGCDAEQTVPLDKLAHELKITPVAATCETNGYEVTECSNCDYRVEKTTSAALGHRYPVDTTVTVPPTCEEEGYKLKTCIGCGKEDKSEVIPPLGHLWEVNDATCYTPDYCDRGCGKEGDGATGQHVYAIVDSETVEATCETNGSQTWRCTTEGCTASYTVETHALGHTLDPSTTEIKTNTTVGTDAGCITQEIKCTKCSVPTCGKVVEVVYDSYNSCHYNKQLTKAATCQVPGLYTYTCSVEGCGHSYTEEIPVPENPEHKWVDGPQSLNTGNTKIMVCGYDGCKATKTVVDASNGVTADDLDNSKELVLGNASITLDDATKEALKETAGSGSLNLAVDALKGEDLGNLVDLPEGSTVYNLTMSVGEDQNISQFDGLVTVRIPYTLEPGDDPDAIIIWYINDLGEVDEIKARYVEIDGEGYAEFQTNHFSYYTVTRLTPAQRCEKYGHSVKEVVQKANCLIDGYVLHVCTRCGNRETKETTEAYGHDWQDTVIPATCTTSGCTVSVCLRCQLKYEHDAVKAFGHSMLHSVEDSKDASCAEAGYKRYVCTNEGCEYTRDVALAKLAHAYTKTVIEPTCTTGGVTVYTCENCGQSHESALTVAKGHRTVDRVVAPTCTSGGYTEHFCEICNARFENTNETEKRAHSWNVKEPTCGVGQTCTVCGAKGAEATNAHVYGKDGLCKTCKKACEHEWYDGAVVLPTCETDGYTKRICLHCEQEYTGEGYEEYKKQESHGGHQWMLVDSKTPTCKANGYGYRNSRCQLCGETQKETLEPLSHEIVKEHIAATCTEDGYVREYCKGCGETMNSEVLSATGHKYEILEKTEVSCETNGYSKSKCTVCGNVLEETVAMTGHNMVLKSHVDPTCTKEGYQYFVCQNKHCNHKEEITLEKLPHAFGGWKKFDGESHVRSCSCGMTETAEHAWEETKILEHATHHKAGEKLLTCADCKATATEEIPQIPHEFGDWVNLDENRHARRCDCGDVEYDDHGWTVKEHVEPTHYADGKTLYGCDTCGATRTEMHAQIAHSFGEWIADGDVHKRVCSCSETEIQDHEWQLKQHVDATCKDDGKDVFVCPVCSHERTEVLPKHENHDFGDWFDVEGGRKRVCKVCGKEETTIHTWDQGAVTKEPTCKEEGIRTYTCTVCGATETESIAKKDHVFGSWTDYNGTKHVRVCDCGEAEYASHEWDAGKETQAPTHVKEGVLTKTCKDCKATKEEPIQTLPGHVFANGWVSVDDKKHARECACGEIEYAEHFRDQVEVIREATHYESGLRLETCTTCGDSREVEIPQIKHVFGDWYEVDGKQHARSCSCKETEYADHEWDEGVVVTPATHLKEGETTYTCVTCGAEKTELQEKLDGHSYKETNRVEPTCTKDGRVTYTCACKESYTEILKAPGHSYGDGGACTVCGEKLPEEGECNHSNLDSLKIETEFLTNVHTCSQGVRVRYVCPTCGETVKTEVHFSHDYEVQEIDMAECGCPCEGAQLIIDACRFCGRGDAHFESGCRYYSQDEMYVDYETGIRHRVMTLTCEEHNWSYQIDEQIGEVVVGCESRIETVYTFGLNSKPMKITLTHVQSQHETVGNTSESIDMETDGDGKEWRTVTQIYESRCAKCGALLEIRTIKIRYNEENLPFWAYMQEKVPMDPYNKECNEFIITGEAYQEAEYEISESGEPISSRMRMRMIQYAPDGSVQYVEVTEQHVDANAYRTYESVSIYVPINGEEVLINQEETTYCNIIRTDGHVENLPTKRVTSQYQENGELTYSATEIWEYTTFEGNDCKLHIKHTLPDGTVEEEMRYQHGDTEITYSFEGDEQNCESGYRVNHVCQDCGEVTMSYVEYGHRCEDEYIDLYELGCHCGGKAYVSKCTVCGYTSGEVSLGCKLQTESKNVGYDEAGNLHVTVVFVCEGCGFRYSVEEWTVRENCTGYRYEIYRLGLSEDGSEAKKEFTLRTMTEKTEHSWNTEVLSSETKTEVDADGRTVTVTLLEEKVYCTACGNGSKHTLTETRIDENGNLLYKSVSEFGVDSDTDESYVIRKTIMEYTLATPANEAPFYYLSLKLVNTYDRAGDVLMFDRYTYTYRNGDYCHLEESYTNSAGLGFGGTTTTHRGESTTTEFLNGENCETGVIVKHFCTSCGETIATDTYYHHITEGKTVDLSQYGNKCGTTVYVGVCPCGRSMDWWFEKHNCSFESSYKCVEGEDGFSHDVHTFVCTQCGFTYVEEMWSEKTEGSCVFVDHHVIRFGTQSTESEPYVVETEVVTENHSLMHQIIVDEFTERVTETGATVQVHTYEAAYVCRTCGYSENRERTVTETDANGLVLSKYHASYAVENGKEFLYMESTHTYGTAANEDGSFFTYQLGYTCSYYSASGEKTNGWTDVYSYTEGNYCVYTVTTTDFYGKETTVEKTAHGKTEPHYELVENASSCEDGVIQKIVCVRCNEVLSTKTHYSHLTVSKRTDLSEYGAVCKGYIQLYSCICGQERSIRFSNNCKAMQEDLSYEQDGVHHQKTRYTCTDPNCGFVYTYEYWYEIDEDCEQTYYERYSLGVDEDGGALEEIGIKKENGYSHSLQPETISQSKTTETDANGNELTVEVLEERLVCSNCQLMQSHVKTVRKTDANGNELYFYRGNYAYDEENEPYLESEEEISYILRTLANGEQMLYTECRTCSSYDSNQNQTDFERHTYHYSEGDFCTYTVTHEYMGGKEYEETVSEHAKIEITQTLLEGATDCKEGWIYREICEACGKVTYEDTRYGHETYPRTVEMTPYGAVCGGHIVIHSCACHYKSSVNILLGCNFEATTERVPQEDGGTRTYYYYTCTNEACGFRYVREVCNEYDASCNRINRTRYAFGLDAENNAAYEFSYQRITGNNHSFSYGAVSTETSTETDANGALLNVKIEKHQSICERCGLVGSQDYMLKTEKTDSNGNVVEVTEEHYGVSGESTYLQTVYRYKYVAVLLQDGTYRTYPTLESYDHYYENGEKSEWWKHEYTYGENNFCMYTDAYTSSYGEAYINEYINHSELTDRYEFLNASNRCSDGVRITETCSACGEQVNEYNTYSHSYDVKSVHDLSEIGNACGGWMTVSDCTRCEYASMDYHFYCSMTESQTLYELDENGREHEIWSYECESCGFKYTREAKYVVVDQCYVTQTQTYSFGIDENGEPKLLVVTTPTYWTDHNTEHSSTDTVESTEIDENGNTLTVRTWENKWQCTKCGWTESRYAYVEKLDANGIMRYSAEQRYNTRGETPYVEYEWIQYYNEEGQQYKTEENHYTSDGNGEFYLSQKNVSEYESVRRADGSNRQLLLSRVYASYNSAGEQVSGEVYTYVYADGDPCNRTETYTDFYGNVTENQQTEHSEYITVYELAEGSVTCVDGVIQKTVCRDCGYEIGRNTYYSHYSFWDEQSFATSCGTIHLSIYRCACGQNFSDSIGTSGCDFSSNRTYETDPNGNEHELITYTCRNCGFVYVRDIWSEYSESCEQMRYTHCTLTVDGLTVFDRLVSRNCGVSHNSEITSNEPTEEEIDGLRVVTTESATTCTRCNKLLHTQTTVESFDAQDRLISREEIRKDLNVEVEGGLYEAYRNKYVYGYYTLSNGMEICYPVLELYADYNADGTPWSYTHYEYTYPTAGDFCHSIRTRIDVEGNETAEEYESHVHHSGKYVLSEGSVTCEDGLDRIEYCTLCKEELYRHENWTKGHVIDRENAIETVDLSAYGAVCGAYAEIYACPCLARQSLSVEAECLFDSNYYSYEDPVTQQVHGGYLYTCAVTDPTLCGFRYLHLEYTETDEKCNGYDHTLYLFGFDPETLTYGEKWENVYANGRTMHHMVNTTTTSETDGRTVEENTTACEYCGMLRETYRYTYYTEDGVDRYDWEHFRYNTEDIDHNYLLRYNLQKSRMQVSERGASRYVCVLDLMEYYDEAGQKIDWTRYEYDYSTSNCHPICTYTDINGANEISEGTDHWWHSNDNEWKDGRPATCTQDGICIEHCYNCEETQESYHSRRCHSYGYDSTLGCYVCYHCGLENLTGADGYVELEDLSSRWGDGTEYLVGFYNPHFRDYLIGLYLVVGEEEYDLSIEPVVEETLIAINVQAVLDAAAELGLDACAYMIRVTFIPLNVDEVYDFAITLDPHVYKVDDANCIIPEDVCDAHTVMAYRCELCDHTYKTSVYTGHYWESHDIRFPDSCGGELTLYFNECRVCGDQIWGGYSSNCRLETEELEREEGDGMSRSLYKYSCSVCGISFLCEVTNTEIAGCKRRQTETLSWDLTEDGTYAKSKTLVSVNPNHEWEQILIDETVETDENGNTVRKQTYEHRCSECELLESTVDHVYVSDADGVTIREEEWSKPIASDGGRNVYEYFMGENGQRYMKTQIWESYDLSGNLTGGWKVMHEYNFETMVRTSTYYDFHGNVTDVRTNCFS
ncbi:MAG: hypothetical protein IKA05_06740 [Clostridia bacterium]|nr:hypothetical protein [Clostridia bacterium]